MPLHTSSSRLWLLLPLSPPATTPSAADLRHSGGWRSATLSASRPSAASAITRKAASPAELMPSRGFQLHSRLFSGSSSPSAARSASAAWSSDVGGSSGSLQGAGCSAEVVRWVGGGAGLSELYLLPRAGLRYSILPHDLQAVEGANPTAATPITAGQKGARTVVQGT